MLNEKHAISKWYADMYDQNETYTDDVEFILSVIGPQPKKILEVCCGSGRILVPLAKAGYTVTGFDADEFMLSKISAKANGLENIKWHKADATNSDWGNGYDVVVLAGNILFNIVSDMDYDKAQELFIQKAADALVPGGYVYIAYNPGGHKLTQPGQSVDYDGTIAWSWEGTDSSGNTGKAAIRSGSYDADTGIDKFTRIFELTLATGEKIQQEVACQKHFATLGQIHEWLASAGFVIELECENFDKKSIDDDSCSLIIYARKK
ncbi:MAG: class I SAM-dependent methyltransferase [Firmicutes bacterium]|nr:class I SAM-dependent methyltransferase [Bacillota bacterium]